MPLRDAAIVPLLAGLLALAPTPRTAAAPSAADGHARMVGRLQEIAERMSETSLFLGRQRLEALRSRLAEPPGEAKPFFELQVDLGMEEFRIGSLPAAVEHLTTALSMLSPETGPADRRAAGRLAYTLGIAHLRLGERANCVAHHSAQSCIFPIRRGGVHVDREGASRAAAYFRQVVHSTPETSVERVAALWLLNIASMTLGVWPDGVPEAERIPPSAFASEAPFPEWPDTAARAGVAVFDLAGGAIADDFDGDHRLDLVTSTWDPAGPLRYFHGLPGGRFEERTAEAGLVGITGGLNLLQADYDDDGDLDVLVLRGAWLGPEGHHPNSLLANDGAGRFTDVSYAAGIAGADCPTQTAGWADFDLDGDLDLYVGNESRPDDPCPGQLFVNDGRGAFVDRAREAAVRNLEYAKGVAWGDFDGDRYPDLYVSNYSGPNRLYRNRGDGTFEDVAGRLGVTGPHESFPAWFWDYDNDGALDLYVSSYPGGVGQLSPGRLFQVAARYLGLPQDAELPRLYRGDGSGGFEDVAPELGLAEVSMTMGANFGDLDSDGWLDLYLGTGYPAFDGLMPNVLYRNRAARAFDDVTSASGLGHLQKGHAVVFADLDGDGDQDVFEQLGGFYPDDGYTNALFENPGFGHRWLEVRVEGRISARSGFGTRITAVLDGPEGERRLHRWVGSGGSFGANPLAQHLGLGAAERVERLEVYWPASDTTQVVENVPALRRILVVEGEEGYRTLPDGG